MVAGHQLQTATPAHLPHGMGQVTEAGGRLPTDVRCDGRRRTPTYPLAHSTARPWWWALPTWGHEGPASGPQLEVMRVAGSCRWLFAHTRKTNCCADATQTTGRVHWGRPGLRRRSRCLTFSWTCPTPSRGVSRLPATAPTTATRDVQCCPAHACGAYTSAANTIAVAATACRGLQRAPTAALPTHRRAHRHTRRRTELACQRWPHARRLAVVVGTGTRGCSTTVRSACVRHLCGTHGVDLGPLPVADGGAGASSMAASVSVLSQ